MTDYGALIQALSRADVSFVIVGGVAAVLHGSARLTQALIAAKIAAGRPKDLEAIAELRALLDERPPDDE